MNFIKAIFTLIVLCVALSLSALSNASTEHGHTETETKGPNGGILLSDGDLSVEITIYETGIPPEMRVYTYLNGEIAAPKDVELSVTLHRLGDVNDNLSFTPENNYLVSNEVVTEPHSYEVSVAVSTKDHRATWHYESFEGRTTLSDRIIRKADILVERASPQTLELKERLFGVIAPVTEKIISITPTYKGKVTDVEVSIGDQVSAGQTLAKIINAASGVSYDVVSPIKGEITEKFVSVGEVVNEQTLFEIGDLSSVWVELSAFPENIEKLQVGQTAEVYDLHQHERVRGEVIYIAPVMTGGHIARARVLIDNPAGHWRPGMHVKADVNTRQRDVTLAVQVDAIQSFRDMPVVFAQYGNTFEVRMVELGESDGEYTEVTGGLAPNTPYVIGNSYILKADVLKDGASHDH
ncbi:MULTISPECIES: efflux RND transporter periplasmic adaptor subunit [Pseudidiomarina]|jgi:cobalt-zinc-cadmium efflux system membrane fusion protein|uniref:Cobalt-zinc-cadmium efflux system membrane fusion protein n=3 Tax=Pseudidiomarina TaxID=2800384 RepID=A0A368USB8_9GAMM|nr:MULTISPECIES: efflux RND transporter periplasmic adaptor subunit [Pseudidiomarina]PWW07859.1 cobalt-zinc-cadmium efflux system membrane fusion protein [Pseudidiomarina maritima]RBP90190.1 cobalt-zinc-cadmium efflux system membrane fusion protein [Pseudidiomarina tainanensis]RCW31696.1 cobalt-zinc-cadmium efflux system membrane fusion protein [Pseudidiomarina tainanensis]RWU08029.1 HlyD family efflux transporter periplasmic adaptor subunit [Pseudidiomarina gelatinasegens]